MKTDMFCYQCEQTAGSKGCVKVGVCGKNPDVANLQDILIHMLKGIGYYGEKVIEQQGSVPCEYSEFVVDSLFSTLTNVNFDEDRFVCLINKASEIKSKLKDMAKSVGCAPKCADYMPPSSKEGMLKDSETIGVMVDESLDMDIRSLRELLTYGLKGMAAYAHHARILGKTCEDINKFFYKALASLINCELTLEDYLNLNMEFGQVNLKCMELLDSANTSTYGNPSPCEVLITKKKGPFIIVSGHDLKDLKMLLDQTEGKGINIYTHSEMLPAHGYPELRKYKHLVGNFGGAWQDQQKEFDNLQGCILMTTNCLMKPRDSYSDRIYTTSVVGWPEIQYIEDCNGNKDFSSNNR